MARVSYSLKRENMTPKQELEVLEVLQGLFEGCVTGYSVNYDALMDNIYSRLEELDEEVSDA